MADYTNIKRVIIRRPVGLNETLKAYKILMELHQQLNHIQLVAERQILPKIIVDRMMTQIDERIDEAAKLSGFANAEDMKYWIENFKDL